MLTTLFSSSSLVAGILFGMLFAWFLASAAMTYMAGMKQPRALITAPEKGAAASVSEAPKPLDEALPEPMAAPVMVSAPAVDEAPKPQAEESAPFPLSGGRRAQQRVGPEAASVAASADSRY